MSKFLEAFFFNATRYDVKIIHKIQMNQKVFF